MGQRRRSSKLQLSFLEALVLGIETEPPPLDQPDAPSSAPEENPQSSTDSSSPDEMADLFSFLTALAQTTPNATSFATPRQARTDIVAQDIVIPRGTENQEKDDTTPEDEPEVIHAKPSESLPASLTISPEWLFDHCPNLLTRIAAIWNVMREHEGLAPLENAEHILAPQLVHRLSGSPTERKAEQALLDCCRALETLAQHLYGDVAHQPNEEVARYVNALMENVLHQPYKDEEPWIRQAMEVAVRKFLAGQSNRIYSAIVVSTLQHPFREIVRELLQANELPFPERVLAQAREKGDVETMRANLQTLARLGLTAQTAALAWEAARHGHTDNGLSPWIARRVDGCIATILEGFAIVEQRVIRYPGYALLAMFDSEKRATRQMTVATTALEQAKGSLWAQGYRSDVEGYPPPEKVVRLWQEYFDWRERGWWLGDEAGRVMVILPYTAQSSLQVKERLRRAVACMCEWGYRLCYDNSTLYFLPAGVELPASAMVINKEEEDPQE